VPWFRGGRPLPGRSGSAVNACTNAASNCPGLLIVAAVTHFRLSPERLPPRPMLPIPEHRRRALGLLTEKHQPGYSPLLDDLMFPLCVRRLWPATQRRP